MYSALAEAGSIDEIVRVMSRYLNSWSIEELERLPENCRPDWVRCRQDIESWADRLVRSSTVAMYTEDERHLDRMVSHFLVASVRARLLDRPAAPMMVRAAA
jgi:hypothetical protein